MDDFGKFCYLDVQKTGSTFISKLLKDCSYLPLLHSQKHSRLEGFTGRRALRFLRNRNFGGLVKRPGIYRNGTFYFNSVRHPFGYYSSLYNYGCDGRGELYAKLKDEGIDHFYDRTREGFQKWLDFIMCKKNAHYLGEGYESCRGAVGFLTYRFLRLSLVKPDRELAQIFEARDAFNVWEHNNICTFTIRQDQMKNDVLKLIDNHLSDFLNRKKAVQILNGSRVNASKSGVAAASVLEDSPIADTVRKKDALIFQQFYSS